MHKFRGHDIVVYKRTYGHSEFYINSPFGITPVLDRNRRRYTNKDFDHVNKDHNDWVIWEARPEYIPLEQEFKWLLNNWEKRKDLVEEEAIEADKQRRKDERERKLERAKLRKKKGLPII